MVTDEEMEQLQTKQNAKEKSIEAVKFLIDEIPEVLPEKGKPGCKVCYGRGVITRIDRGRKKQEPCYKCKKWLQKQQKDNQNNG